MISMLSLGIALDIENRNVFRKQWVNSSKLIEMASQNLVTISPGNGLFPDTTKPLPAPMLIGHQ